MNPNETQNLKIQNISENMNNPSIMNYDLAKNTIDSLSLDTFFNFNTIPTVKSYPNIETFKAGFLAMNEKLYKEAKKSEIGENSLKKNHQVILENKKIPNTLRGKIRRSAMKYCHSQSIIRLFTGYYTLMDYHYKAYGSYSELFDKYLKTVLTVFGSIEKSKLFIIFKEISINERMNEFYSELYEEWIKVVNEIEKEKLILRKYV